MDWLKDISFAHPHLLWLLLLLPLMAGYAVWRHYRKHATLAFSNSPLLNGLSRSYKGILQHVLTAMHIVAVGLLIVALARPQSALNWQDVNTEGIDIVIALDISSSMLARDFKPNRLEASKKVAMEFIEGRPTDRIGLVVYAAESFTQCPLTTDHTVLKNLFKDIRNGLIEDGTAVGLGLANAVNRLKQSDAKSKVVILLTDGSNNRGEIPPLTAAEIAEAFGVRVYTVGVGTNGKAPFPVMDQRGRIVTYRNVEVKIDEETLSKIADQTGGKYFRANNLSKLKAIYKEIDQLEKSIIEVTEFNRKEERFFPWALATACLLALEIVLRNTLLKSIVS